MALAHHVLWLFMPQVSLAFTVPTQKGRPGWEDWVAWRRWSSIPVITGPTYSDFVDRDQHATTKPKHCRETDWMTKATNWPYNIIRNALCNAGWSRPRHCEIVWHFPGSLCHSYPFCTTHFMHTLLPVQSVHYERQYVFYKNVHDDLKISKIIKTGKTRQPATLY